MLLTGLPLLIIDLLGKLGKHAKHAKHLEHMVQRPSTNLRTLWNPNMPDTLLIIFDCNYWSFRLAFNHIGSLSSET